ncbi:Putative thioesterase [Mycobacteroides abscessus subsp. abscessus]|nr:Putative thioesterase [Mycobacteroides abscessus subsp. abscessus]
MSVSEDRTAQVSSEKPGYVAAVPVRWSDIDMYQHVNHATMVTILEEARVPFLRDVFGAEITTTGLLIADVHVKYKGQVVNAAPDSKPAVIADTQLVTFHLDSQTLLRLTGAHREYLQRWTRP